MRKIQFASYKNSKTAFSSLIRTQQYYQGLPNGFWEDSHSELVFKGLTNEEWDKIKNLQFGTRQRDQDIFKGYKNSVFFSSSERDGGCRFKRISPKIDNWEFIEVEIPNEVFQSMFNEALRLEGRLYGWAGIIFAQALGYNIKESWIARLKLRCSIVLPIRPYFGHFCSEVCKKVAHKGLGNKFSQEAFKESNSFTNPGKWKKELTKIFL